MRKFKETYKNLRALEKKAKIALKKQENLSKSQTNEQRKISKLMNHQENLLKLQKNPALPKKKLKNCYKKNFKKRIKKK